MDPPRRPGSGWLQNGGGANSKNQPTLAPTPDPSQITRAVPLPADLIARNGGEDSEAEEAKRAERAKKAAEEREKEEQLCAICYDQLPDVGRGIIACGHVYCFLCIHKWCKTQNDCPGCRLKIRRILKTLSPDDISEESKRKERDMGRKFKSKKQRDKARRRAGRVATQKGNVVTKLFRVRPASLRPNPAQQRAEPHPEAPGGWMYAEAQEAARRQLQQEEEQQQQQQRIQPVLAQGVLAQMAEDMRLDDTRELSPDEVEEVVRSQAAPARSSSLVSPAQAQLELARAPMDVVEAEAQRTRARARGRAMRFSE